MLTQAFFESALAQTSFIHCGTSVPFNDTIRMTRLDSAPFGKFINITPVKEFKSVPLFTLNHHYYATKYDKNYFLVDVFTSGTKYKTLMPHLNKRMFISDARGIVNIEGNLYYICKGIIMNKNMEPLINVMVDVAPSSTNSSELLIMESKVLVDYSIFESKSNVEKTIKSVLLPIFMQHRYKIEICNLRNNPVFQCPAMPKNIERSKDLVYDVIKNNYDTLNKLFFG